MSHPLIELAYGCANASHSAHLAHFNVVGPNFGELHKLYKRIYEYLDEWYDKFGERVRALDETFPTRTITDPCDCGDEGTHTEAVLDILDDLSTQACSANETYEDAEDGGEEDPVSANMVLEFQLGVDKWRWMLRSIVHTT